MKKIFYVLSILLISSCAYSLDYEDYSGSFSERSLIMRSFSGEDKIKQEDKDNLTSRKLTPNVRCMLEQIKKNNYDNVKALLDAKVNPNESYMSDFPVYIAARNNKTEIVKLLVENGAKLDRGFYSELYEAVRNKNTELAQYLIEKGAKVNYQDAITTNSILYTALKNNMYDIASVLIEKGARADMKSVRYIQKKKLIDLIPEDKR